MAFQNINLYKSEIYYRKVVRLLEWEKNINVTI